MKKQVDEMEVRVDQAEKDFEIGIGSSFKKVFTSFLPKRQPQVIIRPLLIFYLFFVSSVF